MQNRFARIRYRVTTSISIWIQRWFVAERTHLLIMPFRNRNRGLVFNYRAGFAASKEALTDAQVDVFASRYGLIKKEIFSIKTIRQINGVTLKLILLFKPNKAEKTY